MDQFKIQPNYQDRDVEVIICEDRDLYIHVYKDSTEIAPFDIAYSGISNETELFFKVMCPELDRDLNKWTFELFIDAICTYFELRYNDSCPTIYPMNPRTTFFYDVGSKDTQLPTGSKIDSFLDGIEDL